MRWGLIGASNIATRVMPAIRDTAGQSIMGVMSNNGAHAKAYAAEHAIPQAVNTVEALLALKPEAVYISSTNDRHAAQCIAALEAGCHVLCEKPLALTLNEAHAMVAAAKRAGRVLATNHHLRASGHNQRIRDLVAEGRIGRLHSVQVSHAVYLPPHLQGWRLEASAPGAGVVLDILVHDVDVIRMLTRREITSISTLTQSNELARGVIEDAAMSVMQLTGNVMVQAHESFVAKNATTRLHLLGTEGSIYATGTLTQAGTGQIFLQTASGVEEISVAPSKLYHNTLAAFVAATEGRGSPLATGEDGVRSVAVALAGLESARLGRRVAVEAD